MSLVKYLFNRRTDCKTQNENTPRKSGSAGDTNLILFHFKSKFPPHYNQTLITLEGKYGLPTRHPA